MIDYVTLLLVNMVAGLTVLATFLWWGIGQENRRDWAPAFGISGFVGTVAGFAMTFTWPIPAPYASAYGEMSVLLGVLFLGAAWTLHCGWRLYPLGIYAFFPGVAAIVIGVQFIHLSLTPIPVMAGTGFIITGIGGIFAGVTLWRQKMRAVRILGGLAMLAAAVFWVPTTYMGYWMHMKAGQHTDAQAQSHQTGETPAGTTSSPSPR